MAVIDWMVIGAYVVVLAAIAIYHWRNMKRQDDVFLAGRTMSRWPVALSMFMALFSTNSFVGLIGWLNREEGTIWIICQNFGIIASVPLVIWLYPALFFRLRVTTAYEYLERRFDYSVRAFASICFMGARIMWMATMLYAGSLLISRMLGWTAEAGVPSGPMYSIAVLGGFGVFFALSGGMRAVIWTDVVQFFVVIAGVFAMAYLAISKSGGPAAVFDAAWDAGKLHPPALLSLTDDISIISLLLYGFVAFTANAGADQLILQTYLSAKSEREIKASLWRNGMVLQPFALIFPVLGLLSFSYFSYHPEVRDLISIPDDALPVFVMHVMPRGLRGLMVAAIISALLTSLSGGMASLSAALQVDFVRRWQKRPVSERAAVLLGRVLIFIWGVTIIAGAIWVSTLGEENNVIQILNIVMYPFIGVLLGIFLLGLLTRRASAKGALWGATFGLLATLAFPLSSSVLQAVAERGISLPDLWVDWSDQMSELSNFYYGFFGTVFTFLVGLVISLFLPVPPPSKIEGLTRLDLPKA